MLQRTATLLMIASSATFFCYWFRYACLLILTAKTARDYTNEVVANIQLSFPGVQAELRQGVPADLARLRASLNHDYEILTSLMRHTGPRLDDRMIQVHYRLMSSWCRLCHTFSIATASHSLQEMSLVVAYFANRVGEQAAASAK
jgi:hypothetical protein